MPLAQTFRDAPRFYGPWVYWFWMNGNVTSNGITSDLEAMARVGVGGVLIMEVDYETPQGPVKFGSQEWRKLFQHACGECARLSLAIRMNNDAGYCGSGGPWITPELSMQKVVWTERKVRGSQDLLQPLEQPETVEGFYRDTAVLAFPGCAEDEVDMRDARPTISASPGVVTFSSGLLIDRSTNTTISLPQPTPDNPSFLEIDFPSPFKARQLSVRMPLSGDQIVHGFLQTSSDNNFFSTVREFDVVPDKQTFNFDEVMSSHFRVLFRQRNPDVEQFVISEIDLSPRLRIEDIEAKALFTRNTYYPGPSEFPGKARFPTVASPSVLAPEKIQNLTSLLEEDGRLRWVPPPGNWTVLRIGHTSTGKKNHPAPSAGLGLECDKLSKTATAAAFNGLMAPLVKDLGNRASSVRLSTHIDSWEVGPQNWTAQLPKAFRKSRNYDPLPYLPVLTGRVVGSLEISERFLWDFRQTVSEMIAENYAGYMRELAHRHNLDLSIEAYDGPNDDLTYAGRADEPMAEFWSWPAFEMAYTCTEMSSAAHVYGKQIVSAEAFTAMDAEKWQAHPFGLKILGDWAFCAGINRMIIHRYALQPWTSPTRLPGMAFGPFGIHFERTQTWWEQSTSWNVYLSRCQYLLQQGLPVADICYLAPEMSPRRWRAPITAAAKEGYAFDGCPPEVLLDRMRVKNGNLVLPHGMSYRLLAIQKTETMSPQLLTRIAELVTAGATVVGAPPQKSPSLENYPACDQVVARLVKRIWGPSNGTNVTEHRLGKGKIFWGPTPVEVLERTGLAPDFTASTATGPARLDYTHRRLPGADVFFVANKTFETQETVCSFRVANGAPQFWHPETGEIKYAAVNSGGQQSGTTSLALRLGPAESFFVVFTGETPPVTSRVTRVNLDGEPLLSPATPEHMRGASKPLPDVANNFTFAFWARPTAGTSLPEEAVFGKGNYFKPRNDALFPLYGHFIYRSPEHAGAGISVGTNGVWVIEHSCDYWGSPLVCPVELTNWNHIAVVYDEAQPKLYINGRLVREGLQSTINVHCSVGMQQRRVSAPFMGGLGDFYHAHRALSPDEIAQLVSQMPCPRTASPLPTLELAATQHGIVAEAWRSGWYSAELASGISKSFEVPPGLEADPVNGGWQVEFTSPSGESKRALFENLISWSDHPDAWIRDFSGKATYRKEVEVPAEWLHSGRAVHIDLGQVAVIAEVAVNGVSLQTLWKPPFRVNATKALRPGKNRVEINVVNLWINRMIGDEDLAEDSPRNLNGSLNAWPGWLVEGEPSPSGRSTFTSYRLWRKGAPRQTSGLLGPVLLIPTVRLEF